MQIKDIPANILTPFRDGVAIPAMPLAINEDRTLDPVHQKAVLRYYIDAGVGGIAVGVHSTQFEIRDPEVALFEPVMKFAATAIDEWCARKGRDILKIAGVCGPTTQACREAELVGELGYHACLLSLAALKNAKPAELVEHCRQVALRMPIIGFYLQPAVGGAVLPYEFWREFAALDNVLAVKMAPFNRYQTLEVVRAVIDAGKADGISLYTGNDDNIVVDLLTEFCFNAAAGKTRLHIRGGLLGHWGVWTASAVKLLETIKEARADSGGITPELLTLAMQVTDMNSAVFDVANGFAGCIPGIHEVLRRQGILAGTWCLNPEERLSPGQAAELDRVTSAYPHLRDDDFVSENIAQWLAD